MIASIKFPSLYGHPVAVDEVLHDYSLRCLLKGAIPDGRVVIRTETEIIPICFEVHVTVGQMKFKEKIKAILESVRGEYLEVFNTSSVTWAFVTPFEDELEKIIKWTQEALIQLGEEREADLFRFALIPKMDIDPLELFTGQIFRKPFTEFVTSLV